MSSFSIALSGLTASSSDLSVTSNNIANADTTAFKKSRTEFQDLLYRNIKEPGAATSATTQAPSGVQLGTGVQVAAITREHTQGSLKSTGRDLDLAIEGNGFFSVQKGNGEIFYTRDGSFSLDKDGRIVTSSGYPMIPEITVPQNAQAIQIALDGRVSAKVGNGAEVQEIGQIQVTTFANPSGLNSDGGNLFGVSSSSGTPNVGNPGDEGYGRIHSQYLEASNVSPVTEMTDLIRAQRVYELNSKVIGSTDQMMSTLNQVK